MLFSVQPSSAGLLRVFCLLAALFRRIKFVLFFVLGLVWVAGWLWALHKLLLS
jgi:predicted RND superfamily exporter protein